MNDIIINIDTYAVAFSKWKMSEEDVEELAGDIYAIKMNDMDILKEADLLGYVIIGEDNYKEFLKRVPVEYIISEKM